MWGFGRGKPKQMRRWRVVGKRANPQGLWLAMVAHPRQGLALYVGDRRRKRGAQRGGKIPAGDHPPASVAPDGDAVDHGGSPPAPHNAMTQQAREVSAARLYGCERFILQRARRGRFVERSTLFDAWACDDNAASARPSV
jgi:hypothetical protein